MSIDRFRLLWRNSPSRAFDAQDKTVELLTGISDKLSVLSALPSILAKIESSNLLLQQVSDNTTCACNQLSSIGSKLEDILKLLQEPAPPVPAPVFVFLVGTTSYYLKNNDIINGSFSILGTSTKDGVLFDSVEILDCPSFLNPIVTVQSDGTFLIRLVSGVTLPVGEFTLRLKQGESDIIQGFIFIYHDYIEIAGVQWARGNLMADPSDATGMTSVIAPVQDMATNLYQFGRKKAWPYSGAVTGWDRVDHGYTVWPLAADPCPAGWRLPTYDELVSLVDAGSTWRAAGAVGNAVAGRFFGPNHAAATMSHPLGCLFLPVTGNRDDTSTFVNSIYGCYWSSTFNFALNMNLFTSLSFSVGSAAFDTLGLSSFAFALRLVKGSVPSYSYSLSMNDTGDAVSSGGSPSGNYRAGEVITLASSMSRPGFDFIGFGSSLWSGVKPLGSTFVMPAQGVTVSVVWQAPAATGVFIEHSAELVPVIEAMFLPAAKSPDWSANEFYTLSYGDTTELITLDGRGDPLVFDGSTPYELHWKVPGALTGVSNVIPFLVPDKVYLIN